MHYGYIGLGNLGANCAACLRRAGFDMTVHDLNRSLADLLDTELRAPGFPDRLE